MIQAQEVSDTPALPKSMHGTWVIEGYELDNWLLEHKKDHQIKLNKAVKALKYLHEGGELKLFPNDRQSEYDFHKHIIKNMEESLRVFDVDERNAPKFINHELTITLDSRIRINAISCKPIDIVKHVAVQEVLEYHVYTYSQMNRKKFQLGDGNLEFEEYIISCEPIPKTQVTKKFLDPLKPDYAYLEVDDKFHFGLTISQFIAQPNVLTLEQPQRIRLYLTRED